MSGDLPLTPEDVAEIVAILDGSGYSTFEIRTARFGLKVARSGDGWTQEWDHASTQPVVSTIVEPVADAAAADIAGEADGVAIRARLPGTFYRAPQPGAPPFVEIGDTVGPETVVGIIETMKLMNPVHAGTTGRIATIPVDNAMLVDAQAVLMRVAPEAS
ncbi:MAG: biotin carboxyl carrier protein [Sphingomonas bacterium]|nr:biotin carboxyl carrier protein [Sphingomonas bacterium]